MRCGDRRGAEGAAAVLVVAHAHPMAMYAGEPHAHQPEPQRKHKGAAALSDALKALLLPRHSLIGCMQVNRTLTRLDLYCNGISDACAAVAAALKAWLPLWHVAMHAGEPHAHCDGARGQLSFP